MPRSQLFPAIPGSALIVAEPRLNEPVGFLEPAFGEVVRRSVFPSTNHTKFDQVAPHVRVLGLDASGVWRMTGGGGHRSLVLRRVGRTEATPGSFGGLTSALASLPSMPSGVPVRRRREKMSWVWRMPRDAGQAPTLGTICARHVVRPSQGETRPRDAQPGYKPAVRAAAVASDPAPITANGAQKNGCATSAGMA